MCESITPYVAFLAPCCMVGEWVGDLMLCRYVYLHRLTESKAHRLGRKIDVVGGGRENGRPGGGVGWVGTAIVERLWSINMVYCLIVVEVLPGSYV
jgi:hypothetical protein